MPLPLLYPLGLAALGLGAYFVKKRRDASMHGEDDGGYGVMTPERQQVYEVAMNEAKDANRIDDVANQFEAQGLHDQAVLLHKRANLRRMPPDVKAARRDAFRKGMSSTNKAGVIALAKSFQNEGASGAAKSLLEYAQGLP